MTEHADWPALPYAEWAPTKKTLHAATQMLGKTKLALAPPQPEWLHTRLFLDPRGFATGPLPDGARTVGVTLDVITGTIWLAASDGGIATVHIGPERTTAAIWADYLAAAADLGLHLDLWDKPQEVGGVPRFAEDTREGAFVPAHAQRFHRVLSSVNGVFDEFRSRFFGRSGVQFWWGSFDLAVLLFNGRPTPPPEDRGYLMRYDLDAEHLNAGFWAGSKEAPDPAFYAYIVPQPPGCETVSIAPPSAGWVQRMGEWVLPYEEVRAWPDPRQALLDFLESVYGVATTLGGWDAAAHEYVRPPASPRG